jgi:hypothetical protein
MDLSMGQRSRDGHPLRGVSRAATFVAAALSAVALFALVTLACAGSAGACALNPRDVVRPCPVSPSAVASAHDPLPGRSHPSLTGDAVARAPFSATSMTPVPLAYGASRPGTVTPYDPLFGRLVI